MTSSWPPQPEAASILAVNSGSSSLKASLFSVRGGGREERRDWRYGPLGEGFTLNHAQAFDALLTDLECAPPDLIGHRFVHGGDLPDAVRLLDAAEVERLRGLTALAPLHMPGNLLGVRLCGERFAAPQAACFDTAFHHTLPELARRLPIPQSLGMRRYGFHGLNYAGIAQRLPALLGELARGRIVAAHLGAGASLCLLQDLQSVDTSMGYTPAGGIPMGLRSGDLDPGVMLELARRLDGPALSELVYHHMGLLALSDGESGDMQHLLASGSEAARFAAAYFCRQVSGAIGAFAARAGGLDALVFSGGIGEHAPAIRAAICAPLGFLGLTLDPAANLAGVGALHAPGSRPILRLPSDEEAVMRDLLRAFGGH